jgi:taurine--2-oxoglutarate transaminase
VFEEDGLIENAAKLGKYLGQRLEEIKKRHVSVGDVRYIGLFTTIELVKDRVTKEPIPIPKMNEVSKFLKDNGLFTFLKNSNLGTMVFVVPPLCITKDQIDEGLEIVERSLELTDAISKK